ncbi:NAD(P)/FAD-dependent oxidoreductase [Polaromonas sp. JS666]|uniref:NAD(P)/FAD-dependent oxidoreductase n=1 Tax=Polaromonas sp. (strain JS666 / ATCC BAA-500) TaxID=296591 RepID=UPI0000464886|nr:FAD-dependent oxidoreductase [Polaromonas sp. JS666]ABE46265.1 FAD dependent oxidoreductase [Polaromonas sp. JS666]
MANTTTPNNNSDVIVIGGGLVGSAVAYGLARQGAQVTLLDEGDQAFRASRGNFGLVWVQGKGYGMTPYARWTRSSAALWPQLAQALLDDTDIDVRLEQPGGFCFTFSDEEQEERRKRMQAIQDELAGDYPFEMLDRQEVIARVPALGPAVTGASYTPMDGHTNPLKLLRALHEANFKRRVHYVSGQPVKSVVAQPRAGGCLFTVEGRWQAPRMVLAAGLGNRGLAERLGLHAPVVPNRGQVLIGERTARFLDYPTLNVRQTDEGTIQLGDSMEEVGFDDNVTTGVLANIAQRGVRTFPVLAGLRLVRAWSALRVMSPDGFPIYDESTRHPGAFVTTCHSGVTLAAAHAFRVAPWVGGAPRPEEIGVFQGDRFLNPNYRPSHAH